jgi:hypothetical protein
MKEKFFFDNDIILDISIDRNELKYIRHPNI